MNPQYQRKFRTQTHQPMHQEPPRQRRSRRKRRSLLPTILMLIGAVALFVLLIPAAVTILAALAGGWRLSVLSFLGIVLGLCFGEWFAVSVPEMGIHNGYAIFFVTSVAAIVIGIAAEILWHKFLAKK